MNIIDSNLELTNIDRRRSLLPWWTVMFCWIFLVLGPTILVLYLLRLLGVDFGIQAFDNYNPNAFTDIFFIWIFMFKSVVALSLWTEKSWAVTIAFVEAWISLVAYLALMLYPIIETGQYSLTVRWELLLLLPHMQNMYKIKNSWPQALAGE
ncbi:hypothetical protein FUAX_48040 (plasmid) [Fulvitalea axinellae]|uniref:Uncharacterized protein n=1 Tax=Fulvitalea axinellae TaxID=1182444 RepID=A0AAU9CWW4_9BACT|nr:hypothetical protein FUAX_48040 [Fulvitalea axinellae]